MEAKAIAKYIGISPLKLRLVANQVRGRKVDEALAILRLAPGSYTARSSQGDKIGCSKCGEQLPDVSH